MANFQVNISKDKGQEWQREIIDTSPEKVEKDREKSRRAPFSAIIIKTGARHWGLPPDAKERRM